MQINPYLHFNGQCDEAIAFYREAIGAEVDAVMRFGEMPEPKMPGLTPEMADKVMHACLKVGEGKLMLSDGRGTGGPASFQGVTVALHPRDEAEARKLFDALAAGGTVTMPLAATFWSRAFGMATDRFGVSWMVNVAT